MLKQPITQVRLTNVAVVRMKKQGKRFEIACYKNKMLNWRAKTETDISQVLQTDTVFSNVSKGQLAKAEDLEKAFGTKDPLAVARIILEKGELQIAEKEREAFLQQTFRDVCSIVAERVFNRETGLPLPIAMIEDALSSLGFSVSMDASAKKQSLKAIELLCKQLPCQIARTQMALRLSAQASQALQIREMLHTRIFALISSECGTTESEAPKTRSATALEIGESPARRGTIATASVSPPPPNEAEGAPAYVVTFLCDPTHYRAVDNFTSHELKPPGSLQIISAKEFVINQNEPAPSAEPPPTSSSQAVSAVPGNKIEAVSAVPSRQVKCRTCAVFSPSAPAYRAHCKTAWHQYNVKRKFKEQPPLAEDEFKELQAHEAQSFLAVD